MSVLESLTNNKVPQLANAIQIIITNLNVKQCIPAHCGVAKNEDANQLAKQGAQLEQPPVQVSLKEKVTII
ncbi:hypothetical protein DPMN_027126 [Dreissena polymorpha]|uniref:RNase H type-1 domain-containing protein n=1 Tax=Dreissena polymorpha TaxID=45954 RepID=A0A9D4LSA8_DREPO|nr:hypothetical protein DPMN_027126 [Dreissena polymorpha]